MRYSTISTLALDVISAAYIARSAASTAPAFLFVCVGEGLRERGRKTDLGHIGRQRRKDRDACPAQHPTPCPQHPTAHHSAVQRAHTAHHRREVHDADRRRLLDDGVAALARAARERRAQQRAERARLEQRAPEGADEARVAARAERVAGQKRDRGARRRAHVGRAREPRPARLGEREQRAHDAAAGRPDRHARARLVRGERRERRGDAVARAAEVDGGAVR